METDFYSARRTELVLDLNSQVGTHVSKWKEMESEHATGIGWKRFELAQAASPEAWDLGLSEKEFLDRFNEPTPVQAYLKSQ